MLHEPSQRLRHLRQALALNIHAEDQRPVVEHALPAANQVTNSRDLMWDLEGAQPLRDVVVPVAQKQHRRRHGSASGGREK